jgi:hypothetical protein
MNLITEEGEGFGRRKNNGKYIEGYIPIHIKKILRPNLIEAQYVTEVSRHK